ncbi:MAG: hypothetical protein QGG50_01070 [Methanopyri archaeon]|nr:hypothetical protein [Methanopyri archaeon]
MATVTAREDREERFYVIALAIGVLAAIAVLWSEGISARGILLAAVALNIFWPLPAIFAARALGLSRWRDRRHLDEQVDAARFRKVVRSVRCDKRMCSDGLCCFVGVGNMVPRTARDDVVLVVVRYKDDDEPARLIARHVPRSVVVRQACSDMKVDAKVHGERLILDLSCKCYDDRPDACRTYPPPGDRCILADHDNGNAVALLGFRKTAYPRLEPFSVSGDEMLGEDYYLVPVPVKGLGPVLFDR